MNRVKLDRAAPAVKKFFRSLPLESGSVELELNGEVLCRVVGPNTMTKSEIDAVLNRGWELLKQTRARNKGVPAKVIEREVREAVNEVRRRH